jgi:flagellin
VTSNLQRIRELAVQSANASNSDADRAALDSEVQQRLLEIDRIASQTSFNGQKILDGSFGDAAFQVGADVGQSITVDLNTSVRTNAIGQIASAEGGTSVTTNALAAGDLTIAVGDGSAVTIGASSAGPAAGQSDSSAYAKADAINSAGIEGLTATAKTEFDGAWSEVALGTGTASYSLKVNDVEVLSTTTPSTTITADDVLKAINSNTSATGVSATYDGTNFTFTAADGRDIKLQEAITAGTGGTGTGIADALASGTGVTTKGKITLSASDAIQLGGDNETYIGFTDGQKIDRDTSTISGIDVKSISNAEDSILRIDSALKSVSSLRSTFGAVQNRFDSVVSTLQSSVENMTAARSRIQDTDFAAETASMTKNQILQQAGTAMLAQANQLPQNILSLLR